MLIFDPILQREGKKICTSAITHISQEPHKCGKLSGVQIFLVQVTAKKWPQDHYFSQKVLLMGTPTTIEDHCIRFKSSDMKIPMQLSGTFSYFRYRLPTVDELYSCDKLFITPDSSDWNPHCMYFEQNERSMLNFEGEIVDETRIDQLPMLFPEREEDMY